MHDLKRSYRKTHRILQQAKERAEQANDEAELITIKEMMSDVVYAIEWMHTGRRPGNKRGIERRAGYQRYKLLDPLRMQSFVSNTTAASPSTLTDHQRYQIKDALSRLSEQERECYVLAHGHCLSYSDIAKLLNIAKSSVQTYVERAQKKVSEDLQNSLFLIWE
ncbi:RNA polymerase subunit sigma-24 [Paenibacillus whitsoniae]|uniref:RNA polymerase subunit sigma-24 n=1 Tax=Paenibacillus whitsoniae TaxID=2496558 RepID=A0A430J7L4_9BACL|nr:RNA polymerase subunit sigma-24 [Paenibacillus whitsoniae]